MAKCTHIFVHCMDFRIQATLDNLIREKNIPNDFDRVSIAGGAGNFEALRKHLELATKLHACTSAVLTVHEECGAGATREDLFEAASIAREFNCESSLYFVRLDGTWEEVKK